MNQEKIRNFCIIAHIDHGKSTLADRMLELTGTVEKRKMREQILDQMDLERERGITIKLQPVRMKYKDYIINLIDTPGHVDFTYEVSRSLAAVEGAILLVDSTQGIEAQTLSTLYQAMEENLVIIPVINKIDLPAANVEKTTAELIKLLGCQKEEIIYTSGKTGQGVADLLDAIIQRVPAPQGDESLPRLLVFDSHYDPYRGVIAYVRVMDGSIEKKQKIKMIQTKSQEQIIELGYFMPKMETADQLQTGEIGYIVTNFKDVSHVLVGDTIILAKDTTSQALAGFKHIQPNVYSSIFSLEAEKYSQLREALEKLKLNDAALTFDAEHSLSLGFGFRCGFLGLLHLEIIKERLEREFNLDIITTIPSVTYKIIKTDGSSINIYSPQEMPGQSEIKEIQEPISYCEIIIPNDYLGKVIELINFARGKIISTTAINLERLVVTSHIPLAEVIVNFFDKLKSISSGYASMSYSIHEFQLADLVRLDILVNGEEVKPLNMIVPKNQVEVKSRELVMKMKELIPKHNFAIPIQAAVSGKIIARETIPALKKDVTSKLYGGDVTRKMKLIEKQRKGKKRLAEFGKVQIPTDVFLNLLKQ